jgi:CelD/BcsL family acetyltransferase involved in cellulose biosynthesis
MTSPTLKQLHLLHFHNSQVLTGQAQAWNDLWQRSEVASPSARAELLALWLETFAPGRKFHVLVVADGDRWVAALPLVEGRIKRFLPVGILPQNEWTSGGDLLVDCRADAPAVLDRLCSGIASLPWPLLWLEDIPFEAPRWQAFSEALQRAGMRTDLAPQGRVAQVEIGADWAAYEATRNGDHRRSRHRYARMLEKAGLVRLATRVPTTDQETDQWIHQAFEIEDRSWKGGVGSSVIRAGHLAFFQRQARLLAAAGFLETVFLTLDETPIAFVYGWRAKGVWFIAKLGYDDGFRRYGPGQQMMMRLLERLHADLACQLLDFWGPLVPWNESWATKTYEIGRIAAAPPTLVGRGLFWLYEKSRRHRGKAVKTAGHEST